MGQTVSPNVLINVTPESNLPGTVDLDFYPYQIDGTVSSVLAEKDGSILIGGWFFSVSGVARAGLAKLRADGSVDKTFGSSLRGTIRRISQFPDGKYLLAGSYEGGPGSQLARLNRDGSIDSSFAPSGQFVGEIQARTLANGQILAWNYGGKTIEEIPFGVSRFSAQGSLDLQFYNPHRIVVTAVQPQPDGKLIVAGYTPEETLSELSIYRLLADGTVDPSFQSKPVAGLISIFLEQDGSVLLTRNLSDPTSPNLVRLLPDGKPDTAFRPDVPGVYPILHRVDGSKQPLISYLTDWATTRRTLDYLSPEGRPLNLLSTTIDGEIFSTAALPDGRIVIAGRFSELNGIPRQNLAILHAPRSVIVLAGANKTRDSFQLVVQTMPGRKYTLESSASLKDPVWTAMPSIEGNGASMKFIDLAAQGAKKFYRVRED